MSLKTAIATGLTLLTTLPAWAQELTPPEIVQQVAAHANKVSFQGERTMEVYRQNNAKPLTGKVKVQYADLSNFNLKIQEPNTIAGIQFNMSNGVHSAYFPEEKLFLFNGDQSTAQLPYGVVLGHVSERPDLLKKNYTAVRMADDFVALTQAYVLDFQPVHGFNKTPGRRFWISHNTFQILREERFWDPNQGSYYKNYYEVFQPLDKKPTIGALTQLDGFTQVNLNGKDKNSFMTYGTAAQAETQENIKILQPTYVPEGFELKNIQVFSLFGGRIQLQNYTDGLNELTVVIRPQQNFYVTLMMGLFSLNLIKKISDISHHIPSNYANRAGKEHIAVIFGDATPDELNKVSASLPLVN